MVNSSNSAAEANSATFMPTERNRLPRPARSIASSSTISTSAVAVRAVVSGSRLFDVTSSPLSAGVVLCVLRIISRTAKCPHGRSGRGTAHFSIVPAHTPFIPSG